MVFIRPRMGKNGNVKMITPSKNYRNIYDYVGIGSDINWCGRNKGGKRCLLCGHHAEFKEWSQTWRWHYILSWVGEWWSWREYAHITCRGYRPKTAWHPVVYPSSPDRYWSKGLRPQEFKSLLKHGCKRQRKCKCVNLIQRGSWYCPSCFEIIIRLAKHHGVHPHDVIITPRKDLREETLILLLSGIL